LQTVRASLLENEAAFDSIAALEVVVRAIIEQKGWKNGDTLWPLRVALSGMKQSPSPFELLWAYGKQRSLARIDEALGKLV
jgi:glutamyl-tRNA synthetase